MTGFSTVKWVLTAWMLAGALSCSSVAVAQSKWTLTAKIPHNNFYHVTWTGKEVIATGYSTHMSRDGLRWKKVLYAPTVLAAASNGRRFVAGGGAEGGVMLWASEDGKTWRAAYSDPDNLSEIWSVTWTGSQFVAVGGIGLVLTSPDGITWTERTSHYGNPLRSVIWADTQLVAVGAEGVIVSKDGVDWSVPENGRIQWGPESIVWTGTRFVAVGGRGLVMTSTDARSWQVHRLGIEFDMNSVTWTGRQFVAVGDIGSVYTSFDGVEWARRVSGFHSDLQSVAWTGSRLVAVGYNGVILTSVEDGLPSK